LAVDVLRQIGIEEKFLEFITQEGSSTAIPRHSGYLESIYLHSRGPTREHISDRTKRVSLFRTWDDKNVKLYWTLPPQWIPNAGEETIKTFYMTETHEIKAKKVIKQCHAIERLVLNLKIPTTEGDQARLNLLNHLYSLVDMAAQVSGEMSRCIDKVMQEIEYFCDDMYDAIIDEWDDEEEIATAVTLFPEDKQREICNIMEKPYMQWSAKIDEELQAVQPQF
jgi:hypothetical protein